MWLKPSLGKNANLSQTDCSLLITRGGLESKTKKKNPKPHEKSYPLIFYELFHDRIPHPEDVSERFWLVMSPAFPEQTLLRAGWVPAPGAQTTDQSTCPRGKTKCALNVGLWEQQVC